MPHKKLAALALLAVLGLFLQQRPAIAGDLTGRASVIDGDTIEIHAERIRLEGVDAPESGQSCTDAEGHAWPCGQRAAFALADHIGQKPVHCISSGKDRYRRSLATCDLGGENLNRWLVANGWAVAYRHYSEAYVPDEAIAEEKKRGIWSSTFIMPWDYRHQKKSGSFKKPATSGNYRCGDKHTCREMTSCAEARFYLTDCGLTGLDHDRDGIPCETLCR